MKEIKMNNLDNKILILEDLLSKEECLSLIEYHSKFDKRIYFQGQERISIDDSDQFIKNILDRVCNTLNLYLNKKVQIDWSYISLCPENGFMRNHKDFASDETVFTSITYLNDDYDGGKTVLQKNLEVYPKTGRTLCFNGRNYWHGASVVTNGNRYTLPIWYKAL